jgi:hypothetical protein
MLQFAFTIYMKLVLLRSEELEKENGKREMPKQSCKTKV